MKNLILIVLFTCLVQFVWGNSVADTLKFDQRFTLCERKWVVLQKADTAQYYTYGFIYIDHQSGFTFDLKGTFAIGKDGKYVGDTSISKNQSLKYRIAPNSKKVALLPPTHFSDLNITTEPYWVKNYYAYTDTVAHNYRWGWIYNDLHECNIALTYLQEAYKRQPDFDGLEFEIVFAYNELGQYKETIDFLRTSLKKRPEDVMIYRELAFAYLSLEEISEAITYYEKGISKCSEKQMEAKAEMAINLAQAYRQKGDADKFKEWKEKAHNWAPENSRIYNHLKGISN